MTPTLPARVGGALCLIALGAPAHAHAQPFSTVQDGPWGDPATWDLGVAPPPTGSALLSHDITYSLDGSGDIVVEDLTIGVNAGASLTNLIAPDLNADLTVTGQLALGNNGFPGHLDIQNGDLYAGSLVVGLSGPGSIDAFAGSINVTGPTVPQLRDAEVGLFGEPATVSFFVEFVSSGGMSFGPDAAIVFGGFFSPLAPAFIRADGAPIDFFPGSMLDLELVVLGGPLAVGEVVPIASTGSGVAPIVGIPAIVPPLGHTVTPVLQDADRRLSVQIDSIPGAFNWVGGAGDWQSGANWDTGAAPLDQGGHVTVASGADATLDGLGVVPRLALNTLTVGTPGAPGSGGAVQVTGVDEILIGAELLVGSNGPDARPDQGTETFAGELRVTDADRVLVVGDASIGAPQATGSAELTSTGTLIVEDVGTLEFRQSIEVGSAVATDADPGQAPASGAVATGDATVTLRNIDTVTVGRLDIADGFAATGFDPGPVTANQNAAFLAENIRHFSVSDDVNFGVAGVTPGASETIRATATFRDVDRLEVAEDLDFVLGGGPTGSDGVLDYEMTVDLDNTHAAVGGDIQMIDGTNIRGSDLTRAIARFNMRDASLLVTGGEDIAIGNIDLGSAEPTPELTGATGNEIRAEFTMLSSTLSTDGLVEFGLVDDGAPEEASFARIRLDDASLATSNEIRQGTRGELVFHVDGLDRVSDFGPGFRPGSGRGGPGGPAVYSAWDVPFDGFTIETAVALLGAVVVDFDFTPPPGEHVFDVISTSAGMRLIGTELSVVDLPAGFEVVSFGIADLGDVTSLRLVINQSCPADFNADAEVNIFDVVAFITAWNAQGPGADFDESGEINIFDVVAFINVWNAGCP